MKGGALMSLKFNPWLALLLGLIVGWLLIWLPTRRWARRQRAGQARPAAPEIELPVAGLQPAGEEPISLTAVGEAPVTGPVAPEAEVEGPGPEAMPAAVEVSAPAAGGELPVAQLLTPQAEAEGTAAAVGAAAAEVSAPPAGIEVPAEEAIAAEGPAQADDLTLIWGIGPRFAEQLAAAGITTFAGLAQMDEARLAEIIAAPAWRKVNYGEWIAQARLMAAGDEAGFKEMVQELSRRRAEKV